MTGERFEIEECVEGGAVYYRARLKGGPWCEERFATREAAERAARAGDRMLIRPGDLRLLRK